MNLTFTYPGPAHNVEILLEFIAEGSSAFWAEPFFYYYPDIDRDALYALDGAGRAAYLTEYFTRFGQANAALLAEKAAAYNAHWRAHQPQITAALEDAFGVDLSARLNGMQAYLSFDPVCPRFLDTHSFDVFYKNSERGALGIAIHEIIHFVWFEEWQRVFADDPAEYDTPHLKWILSEMVVDPIMRDERLASINPYQQNGGTAYPYFYTMVLDGEPVLDTLTRWYKALPMREFMRTAYAWCQTHEAAIRAHIAAAERQMA